MNLLQARKDKKWTPANQELADAYNSMSIAGKFKMLFYDFKHLCRYCDALEIKYKQTCETLAETEKRCLNAERKYKEKSRKFCKKALADFIMWLDEQQLVKNYMSADETKNFAATFYELLIKNEENESGNQV